MDFVLALGSPFITAGYSQIELRIMGGLTQDEWMPDAFGTGTDLHRLTASLMAGKTMEEISKAERQLATVVNFGRIYGMPAETYQKYAEGFLRWPPSLEVAQRFRGRFFQASCGVAAWHQRQKKPHWTTSRYERQPVAAAAGLTAGSRQPKVSTPRTRGTGPTT